MISQAQLTQRRASASAAIQEVFATTITIGPHADLPAARWGSAKSAAGELAGFLATYDLAIRVDRAVLTGIPIVPERTQLTEGGKNYRVERIREAKGDPGLILECKAI